MFEELKLTLPKVTNILGMFEEELKVTLPKVTIALTIPWQTPLNQARMDHFCAHLHALMLDPLTTPDYTAPNLDVANLQCYGDIISDILQDAEETLSAMD